AVQLERAGERFTGIYVRRLATLMIFGAAHAALIWWGDILLSYALMGFLLLSFREKPLDGVMQWAMILYWIPVLLLVGFFVLAMTGSQSAPEMPDATAEGIQATIEVYTGGSFAEMAAQRFQDWTEFNAGFPFFLPRVLGFFLFGVWVWRKGILQNVDEHLPLIRRVWIWSLPLGLAGNLYYVMVNEIWRPNPMEPTLLNLSWWTAASIGIPALSLFYACSVVLLFRGGWGRRLLTPFAAVGRMALTNDLMQSILCTTVFYGFGLALFGKVSPLAGLLLALGIYAAQVAISNLWVRMFRFGPAEWLWRSITYGRPQPVRR
ncbi:MAG: DUF418 domain-containing protein, partial [bacterium]|nr:DUF418 domain-containing protein [bacterium]